MANGTNGKIAFLWSGGGMRGLDIHVGIWKALSDFDTYADVNGGTSAGAIIGALNSTGMTAEDAERLLRSLSDNDVRHERSFWKMRIPWINSFLKHEPIARLLDSKLPRDFSDLQKPLTVHTTDARTGKHVPISEGDLRRAVLASMSIYGVFPTVTMDVDGNMMTLCDGGTCANVPLITNWWHYDAVYIIVATPPIHYGKRREGMLSRLIHNLHMLMADQVDDVANRVADYARDRVRILQPPFDSEGSLRFDHSLIDRAYDWAGDEILCERLAEREKDARSGDRRTEEERVAGGAAGGGAEAGDGRPLGETPQRESGEEAVAQGE